jgi:hypothetical protein
MNPTTTESAASREWPICLGASAAVTLFAHLIFERFFPGPNGVGHDYSGGLTQYLAEYYWSLNEGPWVPAWFTPAFCGGIPLFADPVNQFFSLTGFLMRFADINPLTGSYVTFMTAIAVGFIGTYGFVRRRLGGSIAAAVLAGTLFALNGFLSSRMLVGHSIFHGFAATPLVAWLLSSPQSATNQLTTRIGAIAGTSLCVAYWLYSGGGVLIVAFALATLVLLMVAWLKDASVRETLLRSAVSLVLILSLSAAKLSATLAYMGAFPRSGYLLPGYTSVLETLKVIFVALFGDPAKIAAYSAERLTNVQWLQDRHELEAGLTAVPLLLLVAWMVMIVVRRRESLATKWSPRSALIVVSLILALAIPVALNTYGESWNAFLKSLPLIGSSSALLRWFLVYVPITAVAAALALDGLTSKTRQRWFICGLSLAAVAITLATVDRRFYEQQNYDPTPVLTAFESAKKNPLSRPAIQFIGAFVDQNGNIQLPLNRQDLLVRGASQIACYVPIFGYQLEFFPFRTLRPGSIFDTTSEGFNMKDPACFIFPNQNACTVGAHFATDRRADLERFANYQRFNFNKSQRQVYSEYLSMIALLITLAGLAFALLSMLRSRRSTDP